MTVYLLFIYFCVFLTMLKMFFEKLISSKYIFQCNLKKWLFAIPNTLTLDNPIKFQKFELAWFRSKPLILTNKFYPHFTDTHTVFFLLTHFTNTLKFTSWFSVVYQTTTKPLFIDFLNNFKSTFGDGFVYIRGLIIIFFFDALITDDEPLWEPVEWSLVQSWIMFIFLFAWIAENLISSRYGSYTGRDKRVWFSWYKTFWLVEGWYIISLGLASLWVMLPHYYEVTYSVSFVVSWWNWFSRIFFFKFVCLYSIILYLAYYMQMTIRWVNWKKSFVLIVVINLFLSYLLYTQFFMTFYGYFTDANWYHKTRLVDYVQLSHEPNKWSWGASKRDHFHYHNSKTVFWFKNDGPFASAFFFMNLLFFLSLFSLYIYWVTLTRKVYATQEVTFTFTTYCVSSLKQFFYYFSLIFLYVMLSFMFSYWRLPIEFVWVLNECSWISNFYSILCAYPEFILGLFIF